MAGLPPQNLTQQSGPLTRLASDLGRVRQKYDCAVHFLSGLVGQNTKSFVEEPLLTRDWL
jgi:hypothetical protein